MSVLSPEEVNVFLLYVNRLSLAILPASPLTSCWQDFGHDNEMLEVMAAAGILKVGCYDMSFLCHTDMRLSTDMLFLAT